ncbi:MAG: site-specific integrase [Oscillospiraceae bacterium]|nr:site-specific integrase [Oscillospiraceae bacterium]
MATISSREGKNGISYRIKVSCGYDIKGKQIVKSKTWKPDIGMTQKQTEKELNRIATEFETKVTKGEYSVADNTKFSDFCDQYLQITELAPTTKQFYESIIKTIIKPALGHMKIRDIRPIHSQQLIQQLSGIGVRSDGKGDRLSPATVRRYFTVYQSIMTKAYKLDLIEQNPASTKKLELPQIEEPEIQIFTREEAEHMLSCLSTEPLMFQILIHMAIVTGCRRGELVALKWNSIDFTTDNIYVKISNYKLTGKPISSKKPKTKKSIREIAIPPYLIGLLKQYRTEQTVWQMSLGDRWAGEGWIFIQDDGKPMNPQTPTKWFSEFLKRHDIPHRKFHALRHTSATLLLSSGTNIKNVASRLGHTQLSTTNRYVHALKDADENAAMIFEKLIVEPEQGNEKEKA